LAPRPVAERDHVGSRAEQPLGDLGGDPAAVGCVLAVDDAEAGAELLAQAGEARLERPPAGGAEDVRDEEEFQVRL
jgi:hypothetical protein